VPPPSLVDALRTYLRDGCQPTGSADEGERGANSWLCYMVFDIILAEGVQVPGALAWANVKEGVLAGFPLKHRHKLLDKVLADVPRRIERVRGETIVRKGCVPQLRASLRRLASLSLPVLLLAIFSVLSFLFFC
jgi:hypothetical protein